MTSVCQRLRVSYIICYQIKVHFTINAISIHTSQNLWSAREIRSVSGVACVQPLSKISFTDGYTQFLKTSSDTWNRIINHCYMYAEYVMVQILFRFHIFIPLYLEIIVILSHRRKWFQILIQESFLNPTSWHILQLIIISGEIVSNWFWFIFSLLYTYNNVLGKKGKYISKSF